MTNGTRTALAQEALALGRVAPTVRAVVGSDAADAMAALANSSVGVQRLLLLHDAHVTPLADTEPRALRARCNLLDDEVHELEERVTIVSGRVNELLTTSVPVMPIEQICAALRQAMLVGRPAQAAFTEPGLPPQVWAPPEAAPDDLDE